MKKDRSLHLIWAMFLVFCILFCINIAVSGEHATNIAWMLLELWVLIIDIIILIRYGFPSVRAMVISLALGLTAALTYVDALVLTGRNCIIIGDIQSYPFIRNSGCNCVS